MEVATKKIEQELIAKGFVSDHHNVQEVKDELERDYDRSDYEYPEDAIQDAIEELSEIDRLH